jgi:hypothetical protein
LVFAFSKTARADRRAEFPKGIDRSERKSRIPSLWKKGEALAQGRPSPHLWIALHQDRARLGEQMGNTVQIIKKHYKRAVPKLEADKFWALRPQRPGKIIPMPASGLIGMRGR